LPPVLAFPTQGSLPQKSLLEVGIDLPEFLTFLPEIGYGPKAYPAFAQAVSRMLINAVAISLQLTIPHSLGEWLSQFQNGDQALALRLLRNFKYYSAATQQALLDAYLSFNEKVLTKDSRRRTVWLSYLGRPNKSAFTAFQLAGKTEWANRILSDTEKKGLEIKTYDALVPNLVKRIGSMSESELIDIYLVDDVIGSGGQLTSYLSKFLERDLPEEAAKSGDGERWSRIASAMTGDEAAPRVRLNAVFVIGVKSEAFERHFPDELHLVPLEEPSLAGTRSVSGKLKVKLSRGPDVPKADEITVTVHIIDYTRSIFELSDLPWQTIESLLGRYFGIAKPRKSEHWLQFEPYGWKNSGALVSTHLNCPGNTVPIIWGEDGKPAWKPLFRRQFNSWHDGNADASAIVKTLSSVSDSEMIAYVLHKLTHKPLVEIAKMSGIEQTVISNSLARVETRIYEDSVYRARLRDLFIQVS
jgi:hypothetical protein